MNDYLKFYIPFGIVAVATLGFVLGGHWVWLGIATFPLLAVFDTLLPKNMRRRQMSSQFWATLPVWLASIGSLVIYIVAAWRLSTDTLSSWQIAGSIFSLMWISVVPGGPAAHELWHMRHRPSRMLGHLTQICMFDGLRDIGHVAGHHIDVCTPKDGDTAPRGQNLYWFALHELFVSASICIGLENRSLRARGYSALNWRNRFWRFALAQLVFQGLIFSIAGWQGVAVAVTAMLAARVWVESFNYFQHYGLIRIEGAAIGHRHVWNHMSELSRVASFEITNHAGHHQDSYQPYHKLAPHQDAIPMPSLFICFFAALVPPIWHERIIKPALKRWDLEFATPEERVLAREQNRRAGWPDWIGEAGEQAGRAKTVGC
ncbi:alkane 1-monooxygenase [uncultured Nevskia sp.]|uniref:alkane 1-monooxygenase n=1 Tax=uncultured Nevskia sp. TaxID=228950 RepID=UPI0025DC9872|nr:alkane 1-monooxygenase [uncultured Nevskia sp.]